MRWFEALTNTPEEALKEFNLSEAKRARDAAMRGGKEQIELEIEQRLKERVNGG